MGKLKKAAKLFFAVPVIALALLVCGCLEFDFDVPDAGTSGTEKAAELSIIEDTEPGESSKETEAPAPESAEEDSETESESEAPGTEHAETEDESAAIRPTEPAVPQGSSTKEEVSYRFRSKKLKQQHYEKHGIEMGFDSADAYEKAASAVVNNPAALHKIEKEDGDDIYYVEETNEFVVVSTDGYLRTYFLPSAGKKYYDRQ